MRILIAEDEVTIARALKVMLEKNKYAVDMVHNGNDALDYRFRALLGSEIAAVSVDKLLLSGKKFCHHTDVVFVGGCNFQ